MKKIWGLIGILGMTFFMLAGCGQDKNTAQDASLSAENETPIENSVGLASVINIEDAYYYNDLLTTDAGELYAMELLKKEQIRYWYGKAPIREKVGRK